MTGTRKFNRITSVSDATAPLGSSSAETEVQDRVSGVQVPTRLSYSVPGQLLQADSGRFHRKSANLFLCQLHVPRTSTSYGDSSFAVCGPST